MTVNTTSSQVAAIGNGITTSFTINFQFYSKSDLVVTFDDLIQPTNNYSVTGGNGNTGTINFTIPPPGGTAILISRVLPLIQQASFTRNDPFPSATHEIALDRIVMMLQQLVVGDGGGGGGGTVSVEDVQDIVGAMFGPDSSGITFTYDDNSGSISAVVTATGLDDVPNDGVYYVRRNQTWIQMDWGNIANKPATFPPDPHTHSSSAITDLTETTQDIMAPMLVHPGHTNLAFTYDDTSGTITGISSAGSVQNSGVWIWDDSTTMADPGTGKVRGNAATMNTITQFVISSTDNNGAFKDIFALKAGDSLIFSGASTPGKYLINTVTPATGYATFAVTPDTNYSTGNPTNASIMNIGGAIAGGSGGGGVPEAPSDGIIRGRGNLGWNRVPYADLTSIPASFPPNPHTHVKADITDFTHTHTKSQITDFAHTHPISEVTALQTQLDAINASIVATRKDGLIFSHAKPDNLTYKALINSPIAFTINKTTTVSRSGSCTATWKIDGTPLGGAADTVTSTETSTTRSSANSVAIGQDVEVTISANATCIDMEAMIEITRAA